MLVVNAILVAFNFVVDTNVVAFEFVDDDVFSVASVNFAVVDIIHSTASFRATRSATNSNFAASRCLRVFSWFSLDSFCAYLDSGFFSFGNAGHLTPGVAILGFQVCICIRPDDVDATNLTLCRPQNVKVCHRQGNDDAEINKGKHCE